MSDVRIHYLNHASMLVEVGTMRLLFDPWLEGTAFSGGWGLRYDNPDAIDLAASATHLWISHWHSDHLHTQSLAGIAARNPNVVVLANVSANSSMVERMRGLGFANVRSVAERQKVDLGGDIKCCRYPTVGIDNMLHVTTGTWSILNYNDCDLPQRAIRALRKQMGPVDILLTKYNHAGKLFDDYGDKARKRRLVTTLGQTVDAIDPILVIPFASSHYYRSADSARQNASMLGFHDLESLAAKDDRYVVLRIGDEAALDGTRQLRVRRRQPSLEARELDTHDYGESVSWDALLDEATERCMVLHPRFLRLGRLVLPDLVVRVRDHERCLRLSIGKAAREVNSGQVPHIEAHSQAMRIWLGRQFGDDTFVAGAHFGIVDSNTTVIKRWALVNLLDADQLHLRRGLQQLGARDGRRFVWNRREQIFATMFDRRPKAGHTRL